MHRLLRGRLSCRYTQYARSKLCNVLHVLELQQRLAEDERDIRAYAVSPGRVRTRIFDNLPRMARAVLNPLAKQFFQTPKQVTGSQQCVAACDNQRGNRICRLIGQLMSAASNILALTRACSCISDSLAWLFMQGSCRHSPDHCVSFWC